MVSPHHASPSRRSFVSTVEGLVDPQMSQHYTPFPEIPSHFIDRSPSRGGRRVAASMMAATTASTAASMPPSSSSSPSPPSSSPPSSSPPSADRPGFSADEASEAFIVKGKKRGDLHECMCGAIMQKDGGCNYVKCPVCQREWCWVTKLLKGSGPGMCPFGGKHNCH
ncbi:MAG: hypothetical protein WC483_00615 [Candidatus Paceibacterota bacterium]